MAKRPLPANAAVYQCKSCERDLEAGDFYASNLSRCKECVKSAVRANRAEKIDYYRSYDRLRYRQNPERKAHCIAMGKSIPMSVRVEKQRERRRANPEKSTAREAVRRALESGKLIKPTECFMCESSGTLQAHHHDYSKPLDVFWLCTSCHGKIHTINGDFHRPKPDAAQ